MTVAPSEGRRSAGRAILWGWLLCGVLDITSAIVISLANKGSPIRMLQGIASAVLGPVSFEWGFATAALGLAMHFGVALAATSIFYALSRRIPAMVGSRTRQTPPPWQTSSGFLALPRSE